MAAANVPITRDLLGRLAAGTAGVVGGAFLRRLVAELGAALDAEVAFVAELVEERPGHARTIASAAAPGIALGEGYEFELAGTPCEHAYTCELLRVPFGAKDRYPTDGFLRRHDLEGYIALALRGADGRAIGHIAVISSHRLDVMPEELAALQIFAARAGAEVERRRHEAALRARTVEVAASRARALQAADEERRRIGRDLHDGAQQRLVVLGQAPDLALRDPARNPARAPPSSAPPRAPPAGSPPRASRPRLRAGSSASSPAACIPSGSRRVSPERSPRSPSSRRSRCGSPPSPPAGCRRWSRRPCGSSSPRRSRTRSSTRTRPTCASTSSSTAAHSSSRSSTTARAEPEQTRAPDCSGSRPASSRSAADC